MSEEEVEVFTYLSQIFISAIIPFIMAAVSLWLLYGYTQEYQDFFRVNILYMTLGLVLSVLPSLWIFLKIVRGTPPVTLSSSLTVLILVPFYSLFIGILLFWGVSDAWQLAMGFLLGTAVYALWVFLYQKMSNVEILVEVRGNQKYFYVQSL
ncbi:MAG: hypothetical protein ACFFBD_02255 [Candidatus Hodarchaeota archaeon]